MLEFEPEFLRNLLLEHGSPLLVGSRSIVRRQLQCLREWLPAIDWHYAVKANCDLEILETLAIEGCGFDVASYHELELAKRAFACLAAQSSSLQDSSRILHSHPCKAPSDIAACYRAGQRRFVVDCENELIKLASIAPDARLLIRLNVPNRSGQVGFSHRFGVDMDSIVSLANRSQSLRIPIDGIAFHVGSQATDFSDFDTALKIARDTWNLLQAEGIKVSILDIGGGFPISYRDQLAPPLEEYCRHVAREIDENFGDTSVTIVAEPGRVLCAEAVTLIATVIGKQRRHGKLWYTLDDGRYGTFSGRYFSENTFDFFPLAKPEDEAIRSRADSTDSVEPSMIAGPSCDGGDIVARDYPLPKLEIGDALLVANVGAYSAVSASEFNGIPKAKHLWID